MGAITKEQQKIERLKELIWYICENYNQQLFQTKLWKLVFFCDSDYFEKYNTSITAVTYIKNHRGPTPSYKHAEKAIEELEKNGFITKTEEGTYVALKNYELKHLDNQQIDAVRATCDKYYRLTVNEICTLSHRDPVYLAAEKLNDVLNFKFVAYRDDGSGVDEEESEKEQKEIVFSKKARENLLKIAFA